VNEDHASKDRHDREAIVNAPENSNAAMHVIVA
jgi:hypothetical protein